MAPNKYKSFVIELDATEIEVVGTSFLANSEKNTVFVEEGIVILRDSKDPDNKISLTAGERNSIKTGKLNPIDFKIEWLQDEIILANRSVKSLLEELKVLFPQALKIDPKGVNENCRLTSKFNNISLLEVIYELELFFDIEYEQTPNYILIKSLKCE